MGFGTHGHRDMEIISYVLEGQLSHKDNIGNGSVITPGDVQRMSAGRGVMHSEFNPSQSEGAHFLQIWIEPSVRGIPASYEQSRVEADAKRGRLALIAGPEGSGAAVTIHQDARIYSVLLTATNRRRMRSHPAAARMSTSRAAASSSTAFHSRGDAARIEDVPQITLGEGPAPKFSYSTSTDFQLKRKATWIP
jgi:redox-sensitive bicupin YhaK (pirin superfamily)